MTPEQIRAKKNNIFATYDSVADIVTWAKDDIVVIAVGVAVNTTLEMIAKEMEEDADS
jgi:hypothetical protein